MFVGICRLGMHLPAAKSLKDKRAIVQSLTSRLRNEFSLAAAEVEGQDRHQWAVIGLAVVSNESGHAREVLEKAARYVESSRLDAELIEIDIDVLPAF